MNDILKRSSLFSENITSGAVLHPIVDYLLQKRSMFPYRAAGRFCFSVRIKTCCIPIYGTVHVIYYK